MRGRFITFEGGEGVGKSTQIKRLAARLTALGITVVQTREPGGSPGAEAIRRLLVEGEAGRWDGLTETLLHFAARRDHLRCTINPARARGDWVLCDRFADSTRAYQGAGQGVAPAIVEALHDLTVGGDGPDLTLILDLPLEVGLARAAARGGAEMRYERMGRDFHDRLSLGFRRIAADHPERCVLVDADGSVDEVEARLFQAIDRRFCLT